MYIRGFAKPNPLSCGPWRARDEILLGSALREKLAPFPTKGAVMTEKELSLDLKKTQVKAKATWSEFKAFALKGNVVDLAVAFVIGTAFKAIVDALVSDIIMPMVSYASPSRSTTQASLAHHSYVDWYVGRFPIGNLIGAIVNFFLIAGALFIIVQKILGSILKTVDPPTPSQPTTKECPRCISIIPAKATKCPQCTVDLPAAG